MVSEMTEFEMQFLYRIPDEIFQPEVFHEVQTRHSQDC